MRLIAVMVESPVKQPSLAEGVSKVCDFWYTVLTLGGRDVGVY